MGLWGWFLFGGLVLGALAFDLGLIRRSGGTEKELGVRAATLRSAAWVGLALLFGVAVIAFRGMNAGVAFFTAYFLEESLSIDNIFVFVLIFSQLQIPAAQQRSVLLWGVLGALLARGALIAAGLFALNRFHWIVYPFAAFIIFAAIRLVWGQRKERELVVAACSVCSTWVARLIPITPQFVGHRFIVRQAGKLVATPLFVALVIIETTDVIFALDSVPAVLAVTRDPFLVYTSNIFAMLGLRSLYFVLADAVQRFRYLRIGLAVILVFFGARLLLSDVVEVPNHVSLAVIVVALSLSVLASIQWPDRGPRGPRIRAAA
jgi:tellurite resistance protein TerC